MGFVKVQKTTGNRGRSGYKAAFTVNKQGSGVLRFTSSGVDFMKTYGINIGVGDRVDIFYDRDTERIAVMKAKAGAFKIGVNSTRGDSMRITAKDLIEIIKTQSEYDMQKSDEYDVILVPIH